MKRIGETVINSQGLSMTIIQYINCNNITVKFEDGFIWDHTSYKVFKLGNLNNPNYPYIHGVGYLGIGDYKATKCGKPTKAYNTWRDMIRRCYDSKSLKIRPKYTGCSVCEGWLNFQIFAKWYESNYYEIDNEEMQLDKDILYKGNKIYSPQTCIFVPKSINTAFVKNDSARGNYPIGVSKVGKSFIVHCCGDYLGSFKTVETAFSAYKKHKESHIKKLAEKYIDKIPEKLYLSLLKYSVDIKD